MPRFRPIRWLLIALVALALLRLAGFVVAFGRESLQMDFSAFYTAGEALNAGLDPYDNHIMRSPPIWDGVDLFRHSRFLYPPLVATLFRPVARLPYAVAKVAWMTVSLLALAGSLVLVMRIAGVRPTGNVALATWLVALIFHPLLTFLERGQIDTITMLLISGGLALMVTRRRDALGGLLIALATLLKLHTVLVIPFLVLRKRWRVLAGYAAGGVLLLVLSLVLNGPAMLVQYATVELPRISQFGEWGTDEMRVDPARVEALQPGEGLTFKDGAIYSREYFGFVSNASVGRTRVGIWLQGVLSNAGFDSAQSVAALVVYAWFLGGVALLHWQAALVDLSEPIPASLYWQLVLVIVLLSAPLTWVMNTVWLLALVPFAARAVTAAHPWPCALGWILLALGLVVATLPDTTTFSLLVPASAVGELTRQKYVIAELAVAAGLVLCLVRWQAPRGRDATA